MKPSNPRSEHAVRVHRVAVVKPFTDFLVDVGASVEDGFRRARLPVCALEDVDNYVVSQGFWAFLTDMARREVMPELGFRVGEHFGANCADPKITEMLAMSPTLYRGLSKFCDVTNKTVTNSRMGLLSSVREGYTYYFHSPSCDANNPAVEQIGWFGLMAAVDLVRRFAGPSWQPPGVGLMTHQMPNRYIREKFPLTRFWLSQPFSFLVLPNELLSRPPLGANTAVGENRPLDFEKRPGDFVSALRTLIVPYLDEPDFSIAHIATLCDMSIRSLQRVLNHHGTSYSDVLDEARFLVAGRLLRESQLPVSDIASRLGYKNPSHFSRAFRRISGVTPRSYRKAQMRQSRLH